MSGVIRGDGWEMDVGGNCPVQGQGVVGGRPAYFRARHDGWRFAVAADQSRDAAVAAMGLGDASVWFGGRYVDAGWMSDDHARAIVTACCESAVSGAPFPALPEGP